MQVRSKKHCLEILSELIARASDGIPDEEIFAKLTERERLGSTGLDNGVAFPHCRVDGVDTCYGALLRLAEPIEFESPDGNPVDLVFGLMVPAELSDEHQQAIAGITRHLNDPGLQARLRAADSAEALYEAYVGDRHHKPDNESVNASHG